MAIPLVSWNIAAKPPGLPFWKPEKCRRGRAFL
nr:MAG TPA: hypothetical protein [Caudoviricetes sp.]